MNYDKSGCIVEYRRIKRSDGKPMKLLIVKPETFNKDNPCTGVLWLHGGGYLTGYPEMVFMTRAIDLVRECGAIVVSPDYRLSINKPYPAALKDSYRALVYMDKHSQELGIIKNQIIVGGESAGGGLAAALCMYNRDKGNKINIAFQMPLYPMLDCEDTDSSRDNHAKVWNTRRNHIAWKIYLRSVKKSKVPMYASPSRCKDYSNLPPAYTYVGTAEPFYCETLEYVNRLNKAGVNARVDVYQGEYHAFDMMKPDTENAKLAKKRFCEAFMEAKEQI